MEPFLGFLVGIGLSAACGFRVFVPLLVVSIASHTGHLHLSSGIEWRVSTAALIAFATAELGGSLITSFLSLVVPVLVVLAIGVLLFWAGWRFFQKRANRPVKA